MESSSSRDFGAMIGLVALGKIEGLIEW
jgi:hypothetical protein